MLFNTFMLPKYFLLIVQIIYICYIEFDGKSKASACAESAEKFYFDGGYEENILKKMNVNGNTKGKEIEEGNNSRGSGENMQTKVKYCSS